jgi:hypothetical protein
MPLVSSPSQPEVMAMAAAVAVAVAVAAKFFRSKL